MNPQRIPAGVPAALVPGLSLALNPHPSDDEGTRMARKLAAFLVVARLEQGGAPPATVDEIRQRFREIHPGMFPKNLH